MVANSNMLEHPKVAATPYPNLCFIILDINGLMLEKKCVLLGRKRLYSLRKDVKEFLKFIVKSFEVVL